VRQISFAGKRQGHADFGANTLNRTSGTTGDPKGVVTRHRKSITILGSGWSG
jgi:long-subunit acyl-CoA synthetase (AMP-forming)